MGAIDMWAGLFFLIGALAAFLAVWLGFAAVPLVVFYVVVTAIDPRARAHAAAGPLGFGTMLVVVALYQAASCPAVMPTEGGRLTCEDGADVRLLLAAGLVALAIGVLMVVRRRRGLRDDPMSDSDADDR